MCRAVPLLPGSKVGECRDSSSSFRRYYGQDVYSVSESLEFVGRVPVSRVFLPERLPTCLGSLEDQVWGPSLTPGLGPRTGHRRRDVSPPRRERDLPRPYVSLCARVLVSSTSYLYSQLFFLFTVRPPCVPIAPPPPRVCRSCEGGSYRVSSLESQRTLGPPPPQSVVVRLRHR